MSDTRVVYGAVCSWWDTIDKAGQTAGGLPGCPICHGPLYEVATEAEWWAGVDKKVAVDDPVYREFITWLRGRCHRGPNFFENARSIFDTERAEHSLRVAEMGMQSFDRPTGLSPYKNVDVTGARQLTAHFIESSAIHSQSRGWIPTVILTLDHVALIAGRNKGKEQLKLVMDLDVTQEFIDVLITGLERAIGDAEYGLREL